MQPMCICVQNKIKRHDNWCTASPRESKCHLFLVLVFRIMLKYGFSMIYDSSGEIQKCVSNSEEKSGPNHQFCHLIFHQTSHLIFHPLPLRKKMLQAYIGVLVHHEVSSNSYLAIQELSDLMVMPSLKYHNNPRAICVNDVLPLRTLQWKSH